MSMSATLRIRPKESSKSHAGQAKRSKRKRQIRRDKRSPGGGTGGQK